MPVKVTNNIDKFIKGRQKAALRTMHILLAEANARSDEYAPVEYSTLVNSALREAKIDGAIIRGSLGYFTSYAAWLNENENWSPRPVDQKPGPAWNPNAKPHFLDYWGFESPEAKADIAKTIQLGMKI